MSCPHAWLNHEICSKARQVLGLGGTTNFRAQKQSVSCTSRLLDLTWSTLVMSGHPIRLESVQKFAYKNLWSVADGMYEELLTTTNLPALEKRKVRTETLNTVHNMIYFPIVHAERVTTLSFSFISWLLPAQLALCKKKLPFCFEVNMTMQRLGGPYII